MIERIPVPGTFNFREVRGATDDGLAVRAGRLYRSDSISRIGAPGRAELRRLGIRRVIDLRTGMDRRFGRTASLRGTGAERIRLPIEGGTPADARAGLTLRQVYRTVLGQPAQVGAAVRAIASAEGPVLVHCTAGKDRTGVVVALVLTALGVPEDDVVADYKATEAFLAGAWRDRMLRRLGQARRLGVEVTPELLDVVFTSPAPVLRDTLRWLEAEHGGVLPYLAAAGVGEAEVTALRTALLVPRES